MDIVDTLQELASGTHPDPVLSLVWGLLLRGMYIYLGWRLRCWWTERFGDGTE